MGICCRDCGSGTARVAVVIWAVADCVIETVVTVLNVASLSGCGGGGVLGYAYCLPAWNVVMIAMNALLFYGAHRKVRSV